MVIEMHTYNDHENVEILNFEKESIGLSEKASEEKIVNPVVILDDEKEFVAEEIKKMIANW